MAESLLIRQSQLLNQVVRDHGTLDELGRIEVLWMYPPAHRVLGFVCKTGFFGNQKLAFKLTQLVSIGPKGILTHSEPQKTDTERVQKLESLMQHEVWSKSSEVLGKITDCVFNRQTGEISHYLYVSTGLRSIAGDVYQVAPRSIVALGTNRMIISNRAVNNPELYREGLTHKLSEVGEFIVEGYTEVQNEWRSLTHRTQRLTEQMKAQLQGLTRETLAEQWRDRSQTLSQQVEARFQTLNVTAEEIFDQFTEPRSGSQDSKDVARSQGTEDWEDEDWPDRLDDELDEDGENWVDVGDESPSPFSTEVMESDRPLSTQPNPPAPSPPPQSTAPSTSQPPATLAWDDTEDFWFSDGEAAPAKPSSVPPPQPMGTPSTPEDDDEPWL